VGAYAINGSAAEQADLKTKERGYVSIMEIKIKI
jgi:hypothetical protein